MKPYTLTLWENPRLFQLIDNMQDRATSHRRRFDLRKGRRLPCPAFRASPLTQEKLDTVYACCLNEQMEQDRMRDKIAQLLR
jgi:hypothetical protein